METHDFITTLQKALGKPLSSAPADLPVTPVEDIDKKLNAYTHKSKAEQNKLVALFMEQARLVHIEVTQVKDAAEAGLCICELVKNTDPEWGDKKSVIAWHHPLIEQLDLEKNLNKDNVDLFITRGSDKPDDGERKKIRARLIQSYIGITSADFCVAQSATLVMRTRPDQPRAVSLVPSIHVAVIQADQMIESLKELYFRLKWDPKEKEEGLTNCMTFISGPSKTADIELEMVFGAHGPRQLHVYVIS